MKKIIVLIEIAWAVIALSFMKASDFTLSDGTTLEETKQEINFP